MVQTYIIILSNPCCKGSARTAVESYINGTNFVSKWNIERHLQGIIEFYFTNSKKTCNKD